jgi:superfamily II DNA/RNA helicase
VHAPSRLTDPRRGLAGGAPIDFLRSIDLTVDHLSMSKHARVPSHEPTRATGGFASLHLPAPIIAALHRQGLITPTPVQAAVVPDALAGRNVLARARTGSGKTLAFGLPMMVTLSGRRSRPRSPRGLIVVPTRELAVQVRTALEPIASALRLRLVTVYGGTPYDRQIRRLQQGADIVVATPGRLEDLMRRGSCNLNDIEAVVLDEADHLCDLGFYPVISRILAATPADSQRMLLSATLDGDVDAIVRAHLPVHALHELDPDQGVLTEMAHHVLVVGQHDKVRATTTLLQANPRSIVFTRTRHGASGLARELTRKGVEAVDLHGNLTQRVRERNLDRFRSGRATVVVATDVAARGIHVDNVGLVVHYDVPAESKSYLHRSGRTARAGESGAVVTVSTLNQVNDVVRLHRSAGVVARHHDIHTAPSPLTADSLSSAGMVAPAVTGNSSGGPKRRSSGGRKPPARSGVRGSTGQGRSSSGQSRRAGGHARSADAHEGRAPR